MVKVAVPPLSVVVQVESGDGDAGGLVVGVGDFDVRPSTSS